MSSDRGFESIVSVGYGTKKSTYVHTYLGRYIYHMYIDWRVAAGQASLLLECVVGYIQERRKERGIYASLVIILSSNYPF